LPWLEPSSEIRSDLWYDGQTLGARMDAIMELAPLSARGWNTRANSIRILASALWGLVFKENCGLPPMRKPTNRNNPRGGLQIGISNQCLVFRLCYSAPMSTPKDTIDYFWPRANEPSSAAQLLTRYADVLRVHRILGTKEIEVTAVLFRSAGAEKAPQFLQTYWIEPLQGKVIVEAPFPLEHELPPKCVPLDAVGVIGLNEPDANTLMLQTSIEELKTTIAEIKGQLGAREAYITELRAGGIGTAAPLAPPDGDSLLEAFCQRFNSLHEEITEILEKTAAPPAERAPQTPIETLFLKRRLAELWAREEAWVRRFSEMIRHYQEDRDRMRKAG
jgi:hypothetical protein